MKLWCCLILGLGVILSMMAITARAESDVWEEEDDKEVLVRTVRGTKDRASGGNSNNCRYTKSQWSECDPKTNMRTRTLSLKKGDKTCEQTTTITKKCKKACRYEKGQFSACVNNSMTREDHLKPNSDPTCQQVRHLNKKCKPEAANTKKVTKGKADRVNRKTSKP